MAGIFLSGCGGLKKNSPAINNQNTPIFEDEDPKKFVTNKKIQDSQLSIANNSHFDSLSSENVQAALADIPLPFSTKMNFAYHAQSSDSAKKICAGFNSPLSVQDIALFYEREMELFGWIKRSSFTSFETLFVFEKPHKQCVVTVRQSHDKKSKIKGTHITIFV